MPLTASVDGSQQDPGVILRQRCEFPGNTAARSCTQEDGSCVSRHAAPRHAGVGYRGSQGGVFGNRLQGQVSAAGHPGAWAVVAD